MIFEKFLEMLDRTEYPENELPLPDTLRKCYGLDLVDVSADFDSGDKFFLYQKR